MNLLRKLIHTLAAAVVLTAAACDSDHDNGLVLGSKPDGATTPSGRNVTSRIEVPALRTGNAFIAHWSRENGDSVMTYCLEYDFSKNHSRWVAFRFDNVTRAQTVGRKDYSIKPQYPADPLLPASPANTDDRSFSRYQHGHLVASADRLYSRTANDNTFFMSNMSPQIASFNSPYWSTYENWVQTKGRDRNFADTLYVVKGGTIDSGQTLETLATSRTVVPKYYFMALLRVKNGAYSAIGFWMEHKDYRMAPTDAMVKGSIVSIDALEQLTGIDFFPNLPDAAELPVEATCTPGDWGL